MTLPGDDFTSPSHFPPYLKSNTSMATVQLILKEKIAHLGSEADIVTVKAGYARYFLVPAG